MELEAKDVGNVVVLRPLIKRLDASRTPQFKEELAEQIADGAAFIALNLSLIDFLDSSGLSAIVSNIKTLRANRGVLVVFGVTPTVMNLFKMTAMDKVFEIYATESEAVAAVEKRIAEMNP